MSHDRCLLLYCNALKVFLYLPPALHGSFPPELSLEPVDAEELYDSMLSALQGQQQAHGSSAWCAAVRLPALIPQILVSCLPGTASLLGQKKLAVIMLTGMPAWEFHGEWPSCP